METGIFYTILKTFIIFLVQPVVDEQPFFFCMLFLTEWHCVIGIILQSLCYCKMAKRDSAIASHKRRAEVSAFYQYFIISLVSFYLLDSDYSTKNVKYEYVDGPGRNGWYRHRKIFNKRIRINRGLD